MMRALIGLSAACRARVETKMNRTRRNDFMKDGRYVAAGCSARRDARSLDLHSLTSKICPRISGAVRVYGDDPNSSRGCMKIFLLVTAGIVSLACSSFGADSTQITNSIAQVRARGTPNSNDF